MEEYGNFQSRKNISKVNTPKFTSNYDYLAEEVQKLNLDEIDFENSEYDRVRTEQTKKQKTYFWIRVFLTEEMKDIKPSDQVDIKYSYSGEVLDTTFICFAKKGYYKNSDGEVVTNYNSEDDTKILCLMVDEDRINLNSDDIPFLRKLFRIGRYYEYELLRRDELSLVNKRTGEKLDYYDIEF